MAKVRIGFSTHFEIENELAGIGTDNPTNTKQVLGNIHATNAKAVGITTITTPFEGFADTKLSLQGSAGAKQHTTSGEIIIEGSVDVSTGTTFTSGPENLTVTDNFTLPGISDDKPTVGTTRFNEDLASLEFYTGVEWKVVNSFNRLSSAGRAVWAGGYDQGGTPSSSTSSIDFINVPTLGNSMNFGDLSSAGQDAHGCGSETRGLYMGQFNGAQIDYITIASEGNGADFGDLTAARYYGASGSSSTRGMHFGGDDPNTINTIDYVEINTFGNALDFGDLSAVRMCYGGSLTNGRVIYNGGGDSFPTGGATATYDKNIIASLGNSIEFGNLIEKVAYGPGGNSNTVRGVLAGGHIAPSDGSKRIQYITLSSGGNAQYFGDLSSKCLSSGAGVTQTRAVFALGQVYPGSTDVNTLEHISIATTGNAQDFGDLRGGNNRNHSRVISPVSDSHGGLGGF